MAPPAGIVTELLTTPLTGVQSDPESVSQLCRTKPLTDESHDTVTPSALRRMLSEGGGGGAGKVMLPPTRPIAIPSIIEPL